MRSLPLILALPFLLHQAALQQRVKITPVEIRRGPRVFRMKVSRMRHPIGFKLEQPMVGTNSLIQLQMPQAILHSHMNIRLTMAQRTMPDMLIRMYPTFLHTAHNSPLFPTQLNYDVQISEDTDHSWSHR